MQPDDLNLKYTQYFTNYKAIINNTSSRKVTWISVSTWCTCRKSKVQQWIRGRESSILYCNM